MQCPNCGLDGTGRFCRSCGTQLVQPAETQNFEETVVRLNTPAPDAHGSGYGQSAGAGQDYGYGADRDYGQDPSYAQNIPDDGYTAWRTEERPVIPPSGNGTGYGQSVDGLYTGGYQTQYGTPEQAPASFVAPPLGRRFGGAVVDSLIDVILLGGTYGVVFGALAWWSSLITDAVAAGQGTGDLWRWPAVILVLAPSFLIALTLFNRLYKVGATGQSWGKSVVGIGVVDIQSHEPIGVVRAFVRLLVYLVPLVPLTVFLDGSGQQRTWADKAAGSRVVQF